MSIKDNLVHFDIYDFYDLVLSRPGMFVGENSLSKIDLYLSGAGLVLTYKRFYELKESEMPENETIEFNAWLNQKLGADSRTNCCKKLLSEFGSEKEALDRFVVMYKEFRGENFRKKLKNLDEKDS